MAMHCTTARLDSNCASTPQPPTLRPAPLQLVHPLGVPAQQAVAGASHEAQVRIRQQLSVSHRQVQLAQVHILRQVWPIDISL